MGWVLVLCQRMFRKFLAVTYYSWTLKSCPPIFLDSRGLSGLTTNRASMASVHVRNSSGLTLYNVVESKMATNSSHPFMLNLATWIYFSSRQKVEPISPVLESRFSLVTCFGDTTEAWKKRKNWPVGVLLCWPWTSFTVIWTKSQSSIIADEEP